MPKSIELALVYRDMWQSSGKYVPRVDQLIQVAQPIIDMGCFRRVETNGGGFEQINLLYGENPNTSVRKWTQPFNDAGIQTQMLERGLNGIRMSPVPKDVRQLMFKVKKKQGTDISRSFDGLNNPQNLALSFQYAKEAGMIAQGALSLTYSPVHTVEYYIDLADKYIDIGAQEICIKDMAGIGRPASVGRIVKGIRKRHPDIIIQYHGHSTPGFSLTSSLEAARNGADIIDVGMEPLSWGTGHADLLAVHEMLKDDGFSLPDIDIKKYMEVRSLTQSFVDEWLGQYINPRNRFMNSLLIGPGLPGGMMGSLMADLEKNLSSVNKWLKKNDKSTVTQDDLLILLFDEVKYVWPRLGYPPLVTPFSQYVKNVSLMNVLQGLKGKPRWSLIDENTWGMIMGKSGKLPGKLDDAILDMAKKDNRTFFEGNPQSLYADELEMYRKKMAEKSWDVGEDEEELMEYAMHPQQYENFKSGKAKQDFLADLAKRKEASTAPSVAAAPVPMANNQAMPTEMNVVVDGEKYSIQIEYPGTNADKAGASVSDSIPAAPSVKKDLADASFVLAPLEGKFYLTKEATEKGIQIGDKVKKGDTVAYIESMKVINAVVSEISGTVVDILIKHGDEVEEDDQIIAIK